MSDKLDNLIILLQIQVSKSEEYITMTISQDMQNPGGL